MIAYHKLDKLLASEIVSLTFVITASLSSIMMMAKIPRYAQVLFSAPDTATTFLMLLLYSFPSIIKFTVPISLLLACSIVTIRMAADRELEAWMASGVSVLRLARMPTILGFLVMLISLFSALFFEPYSNRQFEMFKWVQSRELVEAMIKNSIREKSFINDAFANSDNVNLVMFLNKVSDDKTDFQDVFIGLKTNSYSYYSIVQSKEGELKKKSNEGFPDYIFSLKTGTGYSGKLAEHNLAYYLTKKDEHFKFPQKEFNKNDLIHFPKVTDWTITHFSDMHISLINTFKDKFKIEMNQIENSNQLYPREYFNKLNIEMDSNLEWNKDIKIIEKLIFIFKQISVPISTIFLPIIGICLGIQDPRRKQFGVYLGVCLVIFSLYASISACQQLSLNFIIPPYSMLVVTPLILILIIILLLRWRLKHPPSTGFIAFLQEDFRFKRKRL